MKSLISLCCVVFSLASILAVGGEPPGVVIDRSPNFDTVYVGCPSIAILPNGGYAASHSWFGRGTNNDTSEVFGSSAWTLGASGNREARTPNIR